jgi:hypothetical protein
MRPGSRERIPPRVMILPFIPPGILSCPGRTFGPPRPLEAKGWRAPGSRRAVLRERNGGACQAPAVAFLAVAFAPAGGSPFRSSRTRSAREGGGHAPRLAWLPLPGKRSQLTTSRPTTRHAMCETARRAPHPVSTHTTPHERALGTEPGREHHLMGPGTGDKSRVYPRRRSPESQKTAVPGRQVRQMVARSRMAAHPFPRHPTIVTPAKAGAH